MGSNVFLVDSQGGLQPLQRSKFLEEKQLDQYIETYPELLASALSYDEAELRFTLVETQATIDEAGSTASGRWAADALFLDQTGVLTIVEDKLSSNPEIRRKIVGQMIEYAANMLETLTPDSLQQRLNKTHSDMDHVLAELLESSEDCADDLVETFWINVDRNLQAGIVRMVFVADHLPSELRRIIEFLNRHMQPMEVLGVSIDRVRDNAKPDGPEILVTSTIGMTTRKETKRERSPALPREPLSTEDFLKECVSVVDDSAEADAARRVFKSLSECDAVMFHCHRTPGGQSVFRIVR